MRGSANRRRIGRDDGMPARIASPQGFFRAILPIRRLAWTRRRRFEHTSVCAPVVVRRRVQLVDRTNVAEFRGIVVVIPLQHERRTHRGAMHFETLELKLVKKDPHPHIEGSIQ